MFYPVESLRRGGRFYLCWVADSWPLRFAAITHRQLRSQDIRKLCDDLMEVMTNESGRPTNRFSLRLSSQLLRGLVRLYEKKARVLLADLCNIAAVVLKTTKKKHDEVHKRTPKRLPQLQSAAAIAREELENEQQIEELIQNSGNVVSNIQDITLKEAIIPEFQLPPNDNFGEENPDQALQILLADRTIEMMMQETSGAQVSGLDLPLETSDKSHEQSRSRLAVEAPQMESIAEIDVSMFRKSAGDALPAFDKDIPEIPEVVIPEPVPTDPVPPEPQVPEVQEKEKEKTPEVKVHTEAEVPVVRVPVVVEVSVPEVPVQEVPIPEVPVEPTRARQSVDDQLLETLEEQPAGRRPRRRRRPRRLIVDKRTRLESDFLRARIDNPHVEMRFEDFAEAIVSSREPVSCLFRAPAHRGCTARGTISLSLCVLFQRRLDHRPRGLAEQSEQELEQPRHQRRTRSAHTALEKITEVEEIEPTPPAAPAPTTDVDMTRRVTDALEPPTTTTEELVVTEDLINILEVQSKDPLIVPGLEVPNAEPQDVNVPMQVDIADLPTQKLETLSQLAEKRAAREEDYEGPPKRLRSGYMSFRESQQRKSMQQPPEIVFDEPDKENIPPNVQDRRVTEQPSTRLSQQLDHSQVASRLLQEAGLSDLQQYPTVEPQVEVAVEKQPEVQARKETSQGSETPLGSLDRTKVSLGDSVKTTDSQRIIRKQWGIEGTMMKVMVGVKAGGPVSIPTLLDKGPLIKGLHRIIAARCFSSILKLKQHGFVRVEKDPATLEIVHITLGRRFDNM